MTSAIYGHQASTVADSVALLRPREAMARTKFIAKVSTLAAAATFAFAAHTPITYLTGNANQEGYRGIESQWISPYLRVVATLRSFRNRERDWDGYGGVPPTRETVKDAVEVVRKLEALATSIPIPQPALAGDGEIMLLWKDKSFYLALSFFGNGRYSFYAVDKNGKELFGDEQRIANEIPMELRSLLVS